MGIVDEDIARVKAAADIVAVVSEHLALKRVGRRWVGLCPFHAEKTPSFYVNDVEKLFHCFGCQASGDVITFVREIEHLDFVGAVERLAARTGIELHYDDAVTTRDHQRRGRLLEAMSRAVEWYHQRLLAAPDARPARDYLRSRGYDGDVARAYKLGWAPDDWDALAGALRLPDDVLQDTGLGFVNRRHRQQDAFRARVLFPIFDVRGDPVALGGRALPGGPPPKYKNSPETPLYSKSRVLYGLNWAKADVVARGEVIVCEGYTDVIGFARAGLPRAVATCGTALADEHFHTLKNFARRVVLAYDADAAGQAAAERFYDWEKRYEIDIAVAALPSGSDPADVARTDPEALAKAVAEARPFLEFRVERALAAADLRSPEGRARAAEAALSAIREHPSDLVRDQYVMQVAARCRIDPDRLRERLSRPSARPSRVEAAATRAPRVHQGPELEALRLAVHCPEAVGHLLDEVLFVDPVHVAVFRALAGAATLSDAIDAAEPEAATLLQRIVVEEEPDQESDAAINLIRLAGKRAVQELEAEARSTDTADSPLGWVKLQIERLDNPDTRLDAAAQLVAWLTKRVEEQA